MAALGRAPTHPNSVWGEWKENTWRLPWFRVQAIGELGLFAGALVEEGQRALVGGQGVR